MPLDLSSSSSADVKFIAKVIDTQAVFVLAADEGVASAASSDDDNAVVLMFWSEAGAAERVRQAGFEDFDVDRIELFDFLHRWLPGMAEDAVLVGVNWDADLLGTQGDALELAEAIAEAMPAQLMASYEARLAREQD